MVTDRDFVQKRIILKKTAGIDYCLAFKSIELNEYPPIKGVIRGKTILSGFLIRKKDEKKTEVTLISQVDLKGSIPKYLINKVAQKAPLTWIKKFKKALENFDKF